MRRPRLRRLYFLAVGLAAMAAAPGSLEAQSFGDLLRLLRAGGSWVGIPVQDGEGRVDLGSLPTAGMEVEGCARIWSGHSGTWEIRAEDVGSDRLLEATVRPGEAVHFRHATGNTARVRVDVRWSEPRDTTLVLWVGVRRAGRSDDGELCAPG